MKKRIGLLILLFFVAIVFLVNGPLPIFKQGTSYKREGGHPRIILAQGTEKEEKKEEADPHLISMLKQISEKLDGWLKSLNERIEREDVTRFEVRFLEFLRNILEWIKEKIDSYIESSTKRKPGEEKGRFKDTLLRNSLQFKEG